MFGAGAKVLRVLFRDEFVRVNFAGLPKNFSLADLRELVARWPVYNCSLEKAHGEETQTHGCTLKPNKSFNVHEGGTPLRPC